MIIRHSLKEKLDLFPNITITINDRISDLPCDLLNQILCLLSSRDIMRLSVLSKRWRQMCCSLPCLNLDLDKHAGHLMKLPNGETLEKFINAVLCHYDASHLHMFRLICRSTCIEKFIPKFSTEVIKFNPRIIYLDVPTSYRYSSFARIFTCKSVEKLHSMHIHFIALWRLIPGKTDVVTLLNLKKLCLTGALFDGKSFGDVLSGCPVIEDLSLKYCIMPKHCIISNTTLKLLSLEGCTYFRLLICAPNLVSLDFDSLGRQPILMNLSSLVFARVKYYYPYGSIVGLSAVQHLDLCASQLKTLLDKELAKLPKFQNLKTLSLNGWCMACHSGPVAWFLENSPHLYKLTVCLDRHHCLVKNKKNHSNLKHMEAARCIKLKKLVVRVSKGYKRAYGSGMAFLIVAKEIEIAEIVLCNRV